MTSDDSPIAVDGLPREVLPPPDLEQRVAARLRTAGALASPRTPPLRPWRQAVAAAAVFVVGIAVGQAWQFGRPDGNGSDRGRYLLLLYPGSAPAVAAAEEAALAREYGAWAATERSAGRAVDGERLASSAIDVGVRAIAPSTDTALEGYFVVSAASASEAATVAQASPHVRRGGRIVVRAIDTPE